MQKKSVAYRILVLYQARRDSKYIIQGKETERTTMERRQSKHTENGDKEQGAFTHEVTEKKKTQPNAMTTRKHRLR